MSAFAFLNCQLCKSSTTVREGDQDDVQNGGSSLRDDFGGIGGILGDGLAILENLS
jgi:hypothetical protein